MFNVNVPSGDGIWTEKLFDPFGQKITNQNNAFVLSGFVFIRAYSEPCMIDDSPIVLDNTSGCFGWDFAQNPSAEGDIWIY